MKDLITGANSVRLFLQSHATAQISYDDDGYLQIMFEWSYDDDEVLEAVSKFLEKCDYELNDSSRFGFVYINVICEGISVFQNELQEPARMLN